MFANAETSVHLFHRRRPLPTMTTDHNPNPLHPNTSLTAAVNPPAARTLPPRRPLSRRALALAWLAAVAVPVLFLLTAVAFLIATNFNVLEWME